MDFSADCCSAHFLFCVSPALAINDGSGDPLGMELEGQTASADLPPAVLLESASKISRLMFAWPLVVSRSLRA